MKYFLLFLGVLAIITLISSCVNTDDTDYVAVNEQEISDYLENNNIDATATGSGLYYRITKPGNQIQYPTATSNVSVYYRGYTLSGSTFDSRQAPQAPITFNLQGVIQGWTEGIQLVSKGGEIQLFIPSHLGYGSNPPTSAIPANGVLIFDVELVDF